MVWCDIYLSVINTNNLISAYSKNAVILLLSATTDTELTSRVDVL